MKIAFVCELPKEHFLYWNDGLRAALDYLENQYNWNIDIYNLPSLTNVNLSAEKIDSYDFALYWGAFNRPQHKQKIFKKSGLCFAGGPTYHEYANNFDIIFAESAVDLEEFKAKNLNSVQAFGTNTKLFQPNKQPKFIDFLYPAAFAKWKRHDLFTEYVLRRRSGVGSLAIAVGYIQPDNYEYECVEVCLNNNISVLPWIPANALTWLYNGTNEVVISAEPIGGGQRTVLEAKSCGIPVTILNLEHKKLTELANLTREEVLQNWSEISYAEKLKFGIEKVINNVPNGPYFSFNPQSGLAYQG